MQLGHMAHHCSHVLNFTGSTVKFKQYTNLLAVQKSVNVTEVFEYPSTAQKTNFLGVDYMLPNISSFCQFAHMEIEIMISQMPQFQYTDQMIL